MWVRERLGAERVSERRACQVLGQVRSTQRVVAQFQSPRGFRALYVTTTEFAPTQAFLELSADSAPHT